MGHYIEYIAATPERETREWLQSLDGFRCSELDEQPARWEGQLGREWTFWAELVPRFGRFTLAAKYTWLLSGDRRTLDFASHFELELWKHVARVPLVRLDEFLFDAWEQSANQPWWNFEQPVSSLLRWLAAQDPGHWQLLTSSSGCQ